jgi:hypothetical protein
VRRGRPRKFDPTAPRHIDQAKLPAKVYWHRNDRVWYTLVPEGERQRFHRLASADASLADLHTAVERMATRGTDTIDWLHNEFAASEQWKKLSPATQRDYGFCLKAIKRVPTKIGVTFDQLQVDRLRRVDIQKLIDIIATDRPSMANHVRRYLGRLFAWGMRHGRMRERVNPAHELEGADEVADAKMPESDVMERVIQFARERGARAARSEGSVAPYLWLVQTIAYRCRLRGVEVGLMMESDAMERGILCRRRKGSLDNLVKWVPELREAWAEAIVLRNLTWARRKKEIPIHAKDRPLLVNDRGQPLIQVNAKGQPIGRSGLDSAWQRLMDLAVKEGVITDEQRFTLHGMKHRGVTDTRGDKAKKKEASGHKEDSMLNLYDHELPLVEPAMPKRKRNEP